MINLFLARNFASYARLGPSANRRCTEVLRGLDGWPVTQQMSKRTAKNKISTVLKEDMQNKPNLCPFSPKNADSTKKQTQFKPKTNPFLPPKTSLATETNPIQTHFYPPAPCGQQNQLPHKKKLGFISKSQ